MFSVCELGSSAKRRLTRDERDKNDARGVREDSSVIFRRVFITVASLMMRIDLYPAPISVLSASTPCLDDPSASFF